MKTLLCVAFAIVVIPSTLCCLPSWNGNQGQDLCKGLDCPTFQEEYVGKNYEERLYEAANWVGTQVLGLKYDKAVSEGFHRDFDYIQGNNEAGMKIPMTVPVATRVIPGQGPACESNFTIYFFVPHDIQSNAPQPTDENVFIEEFPQQRVYVRSFSGRAYEKDWLENAAQLGEDLRADNRTFVTSYYYTAGYDSPFTIFFRHNEIWFIATD
ncbi:heme-binding protein 2-like [Diadema antillarum]|uniref:heme-binding protein 2-like n=1 Tax=Diadema antillarum TaxID=105358 RepID=UPI003A884718